MIRLHLVRLALVAATFWAVGPPGAAGGGLGAWRAAAWGDAGRATPPGASGFAALVGQSGCV